MKQVGRLGDYLVRNVIYMSHRIIHVVKSCRLQWAGHMLHMEETIYIKKFLGNLWDSGEQPFLHKVQFSKLKILCGQQVTW
jgi:hypothetical protein